MAPDLQEWRAEAVRAAAPPGWRRRAEVCSILASIVLCLPGVSPSGAAEQAKTRLSTARDV